MTGRDPPAGAAGGRFLVGLVLLSSLMGLSIGLARFTTTLYALQLGAHGWMLGAIAAAQSVGMLLLGLPAGGWVARFGARRLFIAGSAWALVLYALLPAVPRFAFLLFVTAALSLAMPLRFVALNSVFMGRLARLGEARAGWFRGSHLVGMSLLGPMLAALLLPLHGPWLAYGLIAATFALTMLAAPLVFTAEPAAWPPTRPAVAQPPTRPAAAALWRDPAARRLACLEFCLQALNTYFAFYIVVIVVQRLGLAPARAGALVAAQGLVLVAALFVLGPPMVRLGRRAAAPAAALTMLAAGLLAWAPHLQALWAGALLLGLGVGLLQVQTLAHFARLGERLGFARVAGLNALLGPSGGLAGAALGGLLEPWCGPQAPFMVFVAAFALLLRRSPAGD